MDPIYYKVNKGWRTRLAKLVNHLRWAKELSLALLVVEFIAHQSGHDQHVNLVTSFAIEEFHLWIVISIYGMLFMYGLFIIWKHWFPICVVFRRMKRSYSEALT